MANWLIGQTPADVRTIINNNDNSLLSNATSADVGVVLKGGVRFLHEYPGTASGSTVYDLAGHNLFIGKESGNFMLTGHANVCLGDKTGEKLTSGSLNTFVGNFAGANITTANANTLIGRAAGWYNQTGNGNTFIGESAGERTLGGDNTFVGIDAGMYCTTGANNVAIGQNTMFGAYLGTGVTGNYNIVFGSGALHALSSGSENIAIGDMQALTTGGKNIAIGTQTLRSAVNAVENVVIGYGAGNAIVSGSWNTIIGSYAGGSTTGDQNVFIGYGAGAYETGDKKLFIDNIGRTNEADARVKALIYGIFDAATANQLVTVNGNINALEGFKIAGTPGVSGTITAASTVTVVKGIITNIS